LSKNMVLGAWFDRVDVPVWAAFVHKVHVFDKQTEERNDNL